MTWPCPQPPHKGALGVCVGGHGSLMTEDDQEKTSPLSSLGQKGGVWLTDGPWPSSSPTGLQERPRGGQGGPTGSGMV